MRKLLHYLVKFLKGLTLTKDELRKVIQIPKEMNFYQIKQ